MDIKTREETKNVTITVKTYIADDGMEFSTYDDAYRHNRNLKDNKIDELSDYVSQHSVCEWCNEWSGLSGYMGGEANLYLVKVDDKVNEWFKMIANEDPWSYDTDLDKYLGQMVFISLNSSGEVRLEFTLDNAIKAFASDLADMLLWRRQAEEQDRKEE